MSQTPPPKSATSSTPSPKTPAAALIAAFGEDHHDTATQTLKDTAEQQRGVQLILALLSIYHELVPELRTKLGMQLMSDYIMKLAAQEN
jgi:hypothetical protein